MALWLSREEFDYVLWDGKPTRVNGLLCSTVLGGSGTYVTAFCAKLWEKSTGTKLECGDIRRVDASGVKLRAPVVSYDGNPWRHAINDTELLLYALIRGIAAVNGRSLHLGGSWHGVSLNEKDLPELTSNLRELLIEEIAKRAIVTTETK